MDEKKENLSLGRGKKLYLATQHELETGFRRYEAIRKLHPLAFSALFQANLRGRNFDKMIDRIVAGERWEDVVK